mmetsp:Transcript_92935/g.248710  ORF Transcript_92935/g.248710 Transcript_92935/m.248710 type:complete len:253 (+) Transcript_92935:215-973(+)
MSNRIVRTNALCTVDVEGADSSMNRNLKQMRSIRRIPTTNHKNEVQAILLSAFHHVVNCVLPFLSSVADRVKFHVMLLRLHRSKFFHHCLLKKLSNSTRFFLVHCSLVSKTDLLEVFIRIESLTNSIFEMLHECVLVPSVENIICDHFCLFEIFNADEVFAEGRGRNSFFVRILPVNHRCQTLLLMLIDCVPNLRDPRACSVHNFNILFVKVIHFFERSAESWKNYDITILNRRKVFCPISELLNELNVFCL